MEVGCERGEEERVGGEATRCWGVTLTSNEGERTVATRARWRVASADGCVRLAAGEVGVPNEVRGVEGAAVAVFDGRVEPPWIKGNIVASAASNLDTRSRSSEFSRSRRSVLSFPIATLGLLSRSNAFSASSWARRSCISPYSRFLRSLLS